MTSTKAPWINRDMTFKDAVMGLLALLAIVLIFALFALFVWQLGIVLLTTTYGRILLAIVVIALIASFVKEGK